MANKKLSYFMREDVKKEEIVDVPGPASIKDEQGEPVVFQIKKLKMERVNEIFAAYRKSEVYMDKKKKQPYVVNGKVVMKETSDNNKAFRHIMTEAVVYPDMHDKELMEFFDCVDVTEMPLKMFTSEEYGEIAKLVNKVLGISDEADEENEEEDLVDAKN